MSFATGWTREYVLNLTLALLLRYYEYAEEWMADQAQLIALEVGYTLGFLKHNDDDSEQVNVPECADDGGVSALLMSNLGGNHGR